MSGKLPWFKVSTTIHYDPKIRRLAVSDRWYFVSICAMTNDGTIFEDEELRDELMMDVLQLTEEEMEGLKKRLQRVRLIDDDWIPVSWDKWNSAKDPTSAERQRRLRARKKAEKEAAETAENVTRDVTEAVTRDVTRDATLLEKRREEERREEGADAPRTRNKKFTKPSREELSAYMESRVPFHIARNESQKFLDHYDSNGWKVGGKGAMKDWQAAARNWLSRLPEFESQGKTDGPEILKIDGVNVI